MFFFYPSNSQTTIKLALFSKGLLRKKMQNWILNNFSIVSAVILLLVLALLLGAKTTILIQYVGLDDYKLEL